MRHRGRAYCGPVVEGGLLGQVRDRRIKGIKVGWGMEDGSGEPHWFPQNGSGWPSSPHHRVWLCARSHPSLPSVEPPGPELPLLAPPQQVPVIRNGGSNTLNFQFHDPAPRTVCNGYFPPRREAPRQPGGSAQENPDPGAPWGGEGCQSFLGPALQHLPGVSWRGGRG